MEEAVFGPGSSSWAGAQVDRAFDSTGSRGRCLSAGTPFYRVDDCLYALQATIPRLTRSSLHRCLQRHDISRLPDVDGDHRLTKPKHPWTNGQVERMNRTLKDATDKRFYYETHEHLPRHLADFVAAYNFARRRKTLKGLTPYEYICTPWTKEPNRFKLNPHQLSAGPYS